jgi:hypothetical protein
MQVKFAYAATSKASDGEASTGNAAEAAAVSADDATFVNPEHAAPLAAICAPFDKDNENGTPTASRFNKDAQPRGTRGGALRSATALAAIPTRIERVQRNANKYGGTISASVLPARQAALEIGAKILAGDGVRAGKVVDSALRAGRHRVSLRAGSALATQRQDADFVKHCDGRSRTPVRIYMPFAFDAARAAADALERADSIETSKMPEVTQASRERAQLGPVAFGGNGDSKEGAITLHDFKDSAKAVLDVVKV